MAGTREIAVGSVATFLLMLGSTLPYPLLDPFVAERFDAGPLQVALYVSVNLGAYVLFAPLFGALSDALGRRRVLVPLGLAIQSVMLGIQPSIDSFGLLLGVRFVEGMGTILAMTALHAAVLDWARAGGTGAAVGAVGAGLAFGVASGAALGGVLGERSLALPFHAGAVILMAAALLVATFLRDAPRLTQRRKVSEGFHALTESPGLWVPVGFSFLERLTVGFIVGMLPLYLANERGLSSGAIGALMAAFLVAFGALQYPFGRLSDARGRLPFIAVGSLLYGGVLALIPFTPMPLLWALMAIGGVVGALMFAPTFALVGDRAPPGGKGAAVALFHLAGSLGFAFGPLAGGAIVAADGAPTAFVLIGALEVSAAVALLVALVLVRLTRAKAAAVSLAGPRT